MTASALIDLIIAYTDNVSATDADNATRRLRLLQYAQEVFENVWNYREWRFKLTSANVTVLAGGQNVVVPANFLDFGEQGGVYDSIGRKLVEKTPQQILEWRELGIGAGSPSYTWAIFDYDATTGQALFQIQTPVTSNTTFKLWYNRLAPTLGDSTTPSISNLHFIPAQYHNSVLLNGVAAKARKIKGDTRDWENAYQRGLVDMVVRERSHKTALQQMPRSVIRSW